MAQPDDKACNRATAHIEDLTVLVEWGNNRNQSSVWFYICQISMQIAALATNLALLIEIVSTDQKDLPNSEKIQDIRYTEPDERVCFNAGAQSLENGRNQHSAQILLSTRMGCFKGFIALRS
jgi:hypothetical protein